MTSGVRVASTQPAMPFPAGKRVPRSVSSPSPDDGLEDELLGLLVEEEDR